jgi:hypothetical protein
VMANNIGQDEFLGVMVGAEFYNMFTETFQELDKQNTGYAWAGDLNDIKKEETTSPTTPMWLAHTKAAAAATSTLPQVDEELETLLLPLLSRRRKHRCSLLLLPTLLKNCSYFDCPFPLLLLLLLLLEVAAVHSIISFSSSVLLLVET